MGMGTLANEAEQRRNEVNQVVQEAGRQFEEVRQQMNLMASSIQSLNTAERVDRYMRSTEMNAKLEKMEQELRRLVENTGRGIPYGGGEGHAGNRAISECKVVSNLRVFTGKAAGYFGKRLGPGQTRYG